MIKGDGCSKWWHRILHTWMGRKSSYTRCNYPGSLKYVDYDYSEYKCGVCNKKWIVDHTPEIKEYEELRDRENIIE